MEDSKIELLERLQKRLNAFFSQMKWELNLTDLDYPKLTNGWQSNGNDIEICILDCYEYEFLTSEFSDYFKTENEIFDFIINWL
jgi:hypothetical protein